MKKNLLLTICIAFVAMLCVGSLSAQNLPVKAPLFTENSEKQEQSFSPVRVGARASGQYSSRGADSPLYYSTASGATAGVYQTTLGTFNTAAQQLATIALSYQAMVEVNDVIYVVTYNGTTGANTFGKIDNATGAFTQIKASAPDAISMAYNPVDGNVYYVIWGNNTSSAFGTIDVETGNHTQKGSVPGLFCIAIDNSGVCYGVGSSGVFGTVSLTNGQFTQISTYDDWNFIQDMAVDFETDELYHFRRHGTQTAPGTPSFRKINKTDGTVTELGQFYSNISVESFVIIGGVTPPPPCAAATNLNATYTADCKAELTWTASEDAVSYNVYRAGTLLANVTETTYTDEDIDPMASHTWDVKSVCAEGVSGAITKTLPACVNCLPATDLTAEYIDTEDCDVRLTWSAPGKSTGSREVVLFEDFESGSIPSTWLNIDHDDDSYTWATICTGSAIQWMGHNSDFAAGSGSYIDPPGPGTVNPDNWLISPQLTITQGELTFWVAVSNPEYPAEKYQVLVSTTGTNIPDDFTSIYDETLNSSHGTYSQRTIDLSAYTGSIYIAFRHYGYNDMFTMMIDDIEVTGETGPPPTPKYNVYRGTTKLTTTPIEETTYTDTDADPTGDTWEVKVVCADGSESNPVSASLENCHVGIKEIETVFTIVPNPAKDKIEITAATGFNKVEIVNFLGQTILSQPAYGEKATIDVSNLTVGVYFVRIISNNGTSVQKFVKQ